LSALAAVAPMMIRLLLRSAKLFAGAVCQTQNTCGSCTGVPIQLKRLTSKATLPAAASSLSRGSSGTSLLGMPMTVPSRGERL
jgi:hypothetical protein